MFNAIKKNIISYLKKAASSFVVKRLLGAAGGLWGWLATIAFNYLWKKVAGPLLRLGFRKIEKLFNERKAKKATEKLREASTNVEIDNAIDDMP